MMAIDNIMRQGLRHVMARQPIIELLSKSKMTTPKATKI
jgi:hypothetical protein